MRAGASRGARHAVYEGDGARAAYSGPVGQTGVTVSSTTDTVLDPRPRVRSGIRGQRGYFGGGVLSASTGALRIGEYEVGPVTQDFPGGGYALVGPLRRLAARRSA